MTSVFVWTFSDVFTLFLLGIVAATLIPMYIQDWWRQRNKKKGVPKP